MGRMPPVIRWLYLNCKYRVCRLLPNEPGTLQKLAIDLHIPLAFTYKANGLDVTLAQQRMREKLNSLRWIAPLVMAVLCCAFIVAALFGFWGAA